MFPCLESRLKPLLENVVWNPYLPQIGQGRHLFLDHDIMNNTVLGIYDLMPYQWEM